MSDPVVGGNASEQRTIVVVPTLNEALNIGELVRRVRDSVPYADLLIVDDQSTDDTVALANAAFAGNPGYRVHVRTGPKGLGLSYVEAFRRVVAEDYARVIQMDADLSHDPASIPDLLLGLEDADLVVGSRYCPGGGIKNWAGHRVALSRFANLYARLITGLGVGDMTAGFRAWRTTGLARLSLETVTSSGYSIQVELLVRARCAGLRIRESPIVFTDRLRGASKVTGAVLLESIIMPWRLRRYAAKVKQEGTWRLLS